MYKIYKLSSIETSNVYVGLTTNTLSRRISKHKNDYKRYLETNFHYLTSFEICKYADVKIELIEETDDKTRERFHIENTENCINHDIPTRTQKEYVKANEAKTKAYYKEWCEKNREHLREYKRKQVKEITCECGTVTTTKHLKRHMESQKHLDLMNNVEKETKEQRNAKYNARRRLKVNCPECGMEMSKASLSRHMKKFHS